MTMKTMKKLTFVLLTGVSMLPATANARVIHTSTGFEPGVALLLSVMGTIALTALVWAIRRKR